MLLTFILAAATTLTMSSLHKPGMAGEEADWHRTGNFVYLIIKVLLCWGNILVSTYVGHGYLHILYSCLEVRMSLPQASCLFRFLPVLPNTIYSFLKQSAMVSSHHPLCFYPSSSLSPTQLAHSISLTWSAFLVLYLLIQVIEFYSLLSSGNLLRRKEGWLCDQQAVWFWWSHFLSLRQFPEL